MGGMGGMGGMGMGVGMTGGGGLSGLSSGVGSVGSSVGGAMKSFTQDIANTAKKFTTGGGEGK